MIYAILSPLRDEPLGYYECYGRPTLEELADHMAAVEGFACRDDWIVSSGYDTLGFAVVQ